MARLVDKEMIAFLSVCISQTQLMASQLAGVTQCSTILSSPMPTSVASIEMLLQEESLIRSRSQSKLVRKSSSRASAGSLRSFPDLTTMWRLPLMEKFGLGEMLKVVKLVVCKNHAERRPTTWRSLKLAPKRQLMSFVAGMPLSTKMRRDSSLLGA